MSLDEIARIVERHDTTVSWAFRRALVALGVRVARPRTRRHAGDRRAAYCVTPEQVAWCMRNSSSPMDWKR